MKRMNLATPVLVVGPYKVGKSRIAGSVVRRRICTMPPTLTTRNPECDEDCLQVSQRLFESLKACGVLQKAGADAPQDGIPTTVMIRGGNRSFLFEVSIGVAPQFFKEMPCKIVGVIPPDWKELKARIGPCDAAQLGKHKEQAKADIEWIADYADFVLINDDLEQATETMISILDGTARGSECRRHWMWRRLEAVLETFAGESNQGQEDDDNAKDQELRWIGQEIDDLISRVLQEEAERIQDC